MARLADAATTTRRFVAATVLTLGTMAGVEVLARGRELSAAAGDPPGLWAIGALVAVCGLALLVRISDWLWSTLTSIETAVVLLVVLAFSCAIGTLVVQRTEGRSEEAYRSEFAYATAGLLHRIGLGVREATRLVESGPAPESPPPGFLEGFDARFGSAAGRSLRANLDAAARRHRDDLAIRAVVASHADAIDAWRTVADATRLSLFPRAPWFRALLALFGVGIVCGTVRFWPRRWRDAGLAVAHLGIGFVLLGGFVTGAARRDGLLDLHKGEARSVAADGRGGIELPFEVRLDATHVEYARRLEVRFRDDPRFSFRHAFDPVPGRTYTLAGGRYEMEILDDREESGAADTRASRALLAIVRDERLHSAAPAAVHVRLRSPEGEREGWLSSDEDDEGLTSPDGTLQIALVEDRRETPRSIRSLVTILEGGEAVRRSVVSVNRPLSHAGWRLYQADGDVARPDASAFQIKWDPGVPLFQGGAWVLLAGSVLSFVGRWRSLVHRPGSAKSVRVPEDPGLRRAPTVRPRRASRSLETVEIG